MSEAPRPILKWAGGKAQLLPALRDRLPATFDGYVEPFMGGGALFFSLAPTLMTRGIRPVLGDANAELLNLYRQVAADVDAVIADLATFTVTEDAFYAERARDWRTMAPSRAAARMIYLNKTCFNGLYRVNRKGGFNVPYGKASAPLRLIDAPRLRAAARALSGADLYCGDWQETLATGAKPGALVFLDPPYLPVGGHADFKRYTAAQFHEADHRALAGAVDALIARGCTVILTNANHPILHDLFAAHDITVLPTRRQVSCRSDKRTGEDAIVVARP